MYLQDFRDGSGLSIEGPTGKHTLYGSEKRTKPSGFDSHDGKGILYNEWSFSAFAAESIGRQVGLATIEELVVRYFKMRDERWLSREGAVNKFCTTVVFL
ncbi:hypothetical protein ATE68_13100 [Sphingopyxis sp. H038]|nr:hypothetical protein ATE78_03315 [Sphingopyxis sp. H012]KTE07955.1 hypothetical protein ATE70_18290 [Sphingopyxis sp. H053]KTE13944.1 hypothetical protein ATE76_10345 [Sphingopyxis sp. H093]KTE23523.1 hypothetical protein ATE75_19380 [Sphingopyxis sp. H080]KTE34259.1 hypothetical protein ATE68_13100 [Sphingopyxis sp. H038]KTE38106.1 hypothetical protein ATE73_20710 [Sphingopyxis sp. H077]KTE42764.1 hypothetical protein ATE77_14585 [Sphingopyxis sp. H005]KTE62171.1 hypothetical protein ATE